MPDPRDPPPRTPTLHFDPPEEDRSNLEAMQTIMPGQFAAGALNPFGKGPPAPAAGPRPPDEEGAPFRPRQRPPMALLCVLHDGDAGGEWIPLRADRCVIARNEGDIRIAHDAQISGRQHAEIARLRTDAGGYRWQLTDLGSTNGTFIRVSKLTLSPGAEVMFGITRYRFEAGVPAAPPAAPPDTQMTILPGASAFQRPGEPPAPKAALVEVTPAGDGARIALTRDEYWLGRDPIACAIVPRDDPFVNARHARIAKTDNGRWRVENNGSRNGVWLRLTQPLTVDGTCQFLLGEQRFILKVLS